MDGRDIKGLFVGVFANEKVVEYIGNLEDEVRRDEKLPIIGA